MPAAKYVPMVGRIAAGGPILADERVVHQGRHHDLVRRHECEGVDSAPRDRSRCCGAYVLGGGRLFAQDEAIAAADTLLLTSPSPTSSASTTTRTSSTHCSVTSHQN